MFEDGVDLFHVSVVGWWVMVECDMLCGICVTTDQIYDVWNDVCVCVGLSVGPQFDFKKVEIHMTGHRGLHRSIYCVYALARDSLPL